MDEQIGGVTPVRSGNFKIILIIVVVLALAAGAIVFFLRGENKEINVQENNVHTVVTCTSASSSVGVISSPAILQQQTAELYKLFKTYASSSDPKIALLIQQLSLQRKGIILALAEEDSSQVVPFLYNTSQQEYLSTLQKNCTESITEIEGGLIVMTAINQDDDHAGKYNESGHFDVLHYQLTTKSDEVYTIVPVFPDLHELFTSGMSVRVRGYRFDNTVLFDGRNKVEDGRATGITKTSPASARVNMEWPTSRQGNLSFIDSIASAVYSHSGIVPNIAHAAIIDQHRVLVILSKYAGEDVQPVTPWLFSTSNIEGIMDTVNTYYKENSYGKMELVGVVNPSKSADVLPWFNTSNACASMNEELTYARTLVDVTKYDHILFGGRPCPYMGISGGSASLGKIPVNLPWGGSILVGIATLTLGNSASGVVIGHELGHNLGNGHANFLDCGNQVVADTGCSPLEYGDKYDIMGGSQPGHFSSPRKEMMGWLDASSIINVATSGIYTIEPIETNTGGVKAIKIQHSASQNLYFEYRQPISFDNPTNFLTGLPAWSTVYNGALMHNNFTQLLDSTPPAGSMLDSVLNAPITLGNTFTDPNTGYKVKVIAKTPTQLTLQVTMSSIEFNIPTISFLSPVADALVTGPVTITTKANDDTAIKRVEFSYTDSNFNIVTAFASPTVPDLTTTDHYSTILDTSSLPAGDLWVSATAYDSYNNAGGPVVLHLVVNNPLPVLTVNPTPTLSFGNVPVGSAPLTANFTVSNTGAPGSLLSGNASIAFNAGTFSCIAGCIYTNLVPGASHLVTVQLSVMPFPVTQNGGMNFTGDGTPQMLNLYANIVAPSPDVTPPSTPPSLTLTPISSTQINLSWGASTDNVAVTGYRVYRGGSLVGSTAGLTYSDAGLTASTAYTYTIVAYDAAANNSPASAPKTATTLPLVVADVTPPSTPPSLTLTPISSTQINLSWGASTDNVAVTGYRVYRGGSLVGSTAGLTYSDAGLTASTAYTYTIVAYDAAANNSPASAPKTATTLPLVVADVTPPSTPPSLTLTPISSTQINLSWGASTDNVAVTGYRVYRGGSLVGSTAGLTYSDAGLTASTAYTYTIVAYDAAANNSPASAPKTATTQAGVVTGGGTMGLIPCGNGETNGVVNDPCTYNDLLVLAQTVIKFLIFDLAAPIGAIMFAFAGFLYVTNGGNESQIKQAHDVFLYVFWGLIVALGAWLAVNFILTFFLGAGSAFNFLG